MDRKSILTSVLLALLAVAPANADNRFVVSDSGTSKELLSLKLSDVKQLSFSDGKIVVGLNNESTRSVPLSMTTVLSFEGDASGISPVVGGAEGLQVKCADGYVSAAGLDSPADAAVFNVSGQRALSLRAWNGSPVSVAALGSGVYILKVNNKSIKFVKK